MKSIVRAVSGLVIALLIGLAFQPAVFGNPLDTEDSANGPSRGRSEVPAPFRDLAELATRLLNASTKKTDTDGDGLYDNVEMALGTEPDLADSDFDKLSDYAEVFNGTDPNKPDSNGDHVPDLLEVANVTKDLDSDGVPNAWDWDNDNDGVMDSLDISPFAKTVMASNFQLNISASGQPTYLTFQLSPEDASHLRLYGQSWDWPHDENGTVQDLDDSTRDVYIMPILEYRSQNLPDKKELANFGISSFEDAAYVPLSPVYEFGNTVAFKGRMYYPQSAQPRNVLADLSLSWKVIGTTDTQVKALKAPSGKYLTADAGGNISAGPATVGSNELFDWILAGGGHVSLRTSGGTYLSMGSDGRVSASKAQPGDGEIFLPEPQTGGKYAIKASNGHYITVKANGSLMADADDASGGSPFERVDRGVRSATLQLANYYEDFTLSGFRLEEEFGAKAGIFYDGNREKVTGANFILALDYLRNANYELGDMPAHLKGKFNLDISSNVSSFDRYELAMGALVGEMPRDAVSRLPNGTVLPIIAAVEDRGRGFDLSDISGSYTKGRTLRCDSTALAVLTDRMLKTTWYNTTIDRPMELSDIVTQIRSWDLTDESKMTLIALTIKWGTGEERVVRVNSVSVDHSGETNNININTTVIDMVQCGMDTIGEALEVVEKGWSAFGFTTAAKVASTLDKSAAAVGALADTAKGVNTVNKGTTTLADIGTALEVIGFVIDVIVACYAFYLVADALGWGPTGVGVGLSYAVLMIAYSAVLLVLALCGGPLGAVIATLIGLSDLIVMLCCGNSWSDMVIGWIVQRFIDWWWTYRMRSEVDVQVISTDSRINDTDNNGVDVGDNITYTGHFYGNVTTTEFGGDIDLQEGYIHPKFTVAVPSYSNSRTSGYATEEPANYTGGKKSTVYATGVSVEPGIGMVNFPVAIGLDTDYNVFYEDHWAPFWWSYERKSETGTSSGDWTTLYFDVMPGSIDDFANWRGMNSSDWDGDGINNTDENGTDMWKWDTDGDGLGDRYERETGTNPRRADSDGDGLGDRAELRQGTNCSVRDTDGDGLSDFMEYSGWVISFQFCGKTLHYRVNSDPMLGDTDGDGIGDYDEYFCLLNPRSRNTDGDWEEDVLKPYYRTYIEYNATLKLPNGWSFYKDYAAPSEPTCTCAISPANGDLYVVADKGVVRFNPDGTVVKTLALPTYGVSDIAIGNDGTVYLASNSQAVVYDANLTFKANWGGASGLGPYYLAADSNGGVLYFIDYEVWNHVYIKNLTDGSNLTGWDIPMGKSYGRMDVDNDGDLLLSGLSGNRFAWVASDGSDYWMMGVGGSGDGHFNTPIDVRDLPDGDLLVVDAGNNRLQKVDMDGNWILTFGGYGTANGTFDTPTSLAFDKDFIYVTDAGNNRTQKLRHRLELVKVNQTTNFTDTDGDGLSDRNETAGWNVTVINSSGRGAVSYHVSSEPNASDSDGDGLNDFDELNLSSDPRSIDTDGDGFSDQLERVLGTNVSSWDTDGDGLDDGMEPTFGSDPKLGDTDGEGLGDLQEYLQGSNPTMGDSDLDGLGDYNESVLGSDLTDPDSDDDFMFDTEEREKGTDPNAGDTDEDWLGDGFEVLYGTDPKDNDTDGDGLEDGFEVSYPTDPLSNDTDRDGVCDGEELSRGLNPHNKDSDGDGVPDTKDDDYLIALKDEIVLVADSSAEAATLAKELSAAANVKKVTPAELLDNHKTAPNIVLVGKPGSGNGTAGGIISDVLSDCGDTASRMLEHDYDRIATRYGYWNKTQTIIMMSNAAPGDDLRILGMLRSSTTTVWANRISVSYQNSRSSFKLDDIATVKATDAFVWTQLDEMAKFTVNLTRLDRTSIASPLTNATGLEPVDVAMDRYLDIAVSDNIQGGTREIISAAELRIYYTAGDLDLTGDGDSDDMDDLNESTLRLFVLDGATGNWTLVTEDLDWVNGTGINTSNAVIYGTSYAGYLWANVTHFCTFGAGGRTSVVLPVKASAGGDITAFTGDTVFLADGGSSGNGAIVNYTWSFDNGGDAVKLYGPSVPFVFQLTGTYVVTLTVTDFLGLKASAQVTVTVLERPGGNWTLGIGPVVDQNGTAIEGALVRLTAGNGTLSNLTNALGIALFRLGPEHAGISVRLTISKDGYWPVEHSTRIVDGKLESNPPAMVKLWPGDDFGLTIGPVKDSDGKEVAGAVVVVTVDGRAFEAVTGANGTAVVLMPVSLLGKDIHVKITMTGYNGTEYNTTVSASGIPAQSPPALVKAPVPKPPGGGSGGVPAWAIGAAIAAVSCLLAVGGSIAVFSRGAKRRPPAGVVSAGQAPAEPVVAEEYKTTNIEGTRGTPELSSIPEPDKPAEATPQEMAGAEAPAALVPVQAPEQVADEVPPPKMKKKKRADS